jgi:RNA polymerase sigma-70 factor (ECF subfamily)
VARRVASPADVDDVVQDVALRIHRGIAELQDDERFGGWVYRIAKRAIADLHRDRVRHPLPRSQTGDPADVPVSGDGDEVESDLGECVALFVARLPSPYREAVTLTELQGLTHKEAATVLGVSLSGMKSRVQRGRERIRRMFEECCEISLDCRGKVTECVPRSRA